MEPIEIFAVIANLIGLFLICVFLDPYYRRYKAWVDAKFEKWNRRFKDGT